MLKGLGEEAAAARVVVTVLVERGRERQQMRARRIEEEETPARDMCFFFLAVKRFNADLEDARFQPRVLN